MRLIDADKLKEKASKMMFEKATGFGSFDAVGVLDIDAAPTIDPETLRPTAEWISVKDRMPEPHTNVLFFGRYGFFIGWYSHLMKKWRSDEYGEVQEVTHWMPLPNPPEATND